MGRVRSGIHFLNAAILALAGEELPREAYGLGEGRPKEQKTKELVARRARNKRARAERKRQRRQSWTG